MSRFFVIDEVRPAWIHANMPPGVPLGPAVLERDEAGRAKMPAHLLTAHKAN